MKSSFQNVVNAGSVCNCRKNSTFRFSSYRGSVNWKKIEELDIDRLINDQDVDLLVSNLSSVINYNLTNDSRYHMKVLDDNFVKLFRLAQLAVDYLLNCKNYFENCVCELEKNIDAVNKELVAARKDCREKKMIIKTLKLKLKEKEITLGRQYNRDLLFDGKKVFEYCMAANARYAEQLEKDGKSLYSKKNIDETMQTRNNLECRCEMCGKIFINKLYLYGHQVRRHEEVLINGRVTGNVGCKDELLHSEIKELKERLNFAESQLKINFSTALGDTRKQKRESVVVENDGNGSGFPVVKLLPLETGELSEGTINMADDNSKCGDETRKLNGKVEMRNTTYKDDLESLRNMLHSAIKKLRVSDSGGTYKCNTDLSTDDCRLYDVKNGVPLNTDIMQVPSELPQSNISAPSDEGNSVKELLGQSDHTAVHVESVKDSSPPSEYNLVPLSSSARGDDAEGDNYPLKDEKLDCSVEIIASKSVEQCDDEVTVERKEENNGVRNIKSTVTGTNTPISKSNLFYDTGRVNKTRQRTSNRLISLSAMRSFGNDPLIDASNQDQESSTLIGDSHLSDDNNKIDVVDGSSVSSIEEIAVSSEGIKTCDPIESTSETIKLNKEFVKTEPMVNKSERFVPAKQCNESGIMVVQNVSDSEKSSTPSAVKMRKRNLVSHKSVWIDDSNEDSVSSQVKGEEINGNPTEMPIILITEHKDDFNVIASSSTTTVSDINKSNLLVGFPNDRHLEKNPSNNSSTSDISLESLNYGDQDEISGKRSLDNDRVNVGDDVMSVPCDPECSAISSRNVKAGSGEKKRVDAAKVQFHRDSMAKDDVVLLSTSSTTSSPKSPTKMKEKHVSSVDSQENLNHSDLNVSGDLEISVSSSADSDTDGDRMESVDRQSLSLPTVEKLLASNPEIFESLRKDLEELLDRRLRDLGVDPEWTALPNKTFHDKMDQLKHHMKITSKRYRSYFAFQKQIEEELDAHYCKKYGLNCERKEKSLLLSQQKNFYDNDGHHKFHKEGNVSSLNHKDEISTKSLRKSHHCLKYSDVKNCRRGSQLFNSLSKSDDAVSDEDNKSVAEISVGASTTSARTLHLTSPLLMADVESDSDEEIGGTVMTMYNKYKASDHCSSTPKESVMNMSGASSTDPFHSAVLGRLNTSGSIKITMPSESSNITTTLDHRKRVQTLSAMSTVSSGKKKKRVLFVDEAFVN